MSSPKCKKILFKYLPQIVNNIPEEWLGTTYNNSNLLGKYDFSNNLLKLISEREMDGKNISKNDLLELGYAEDYLRVSSNISVIVELVFSIKYNFDINNVLTFSSNYIIIFAICTIFKNNIKIIIDPSYTIHNDITKIINVHSIIKKFNNKVTLQVCNPQKDDNALILFITENMENKSKYKSFIDIFIVINFIKYNVNELFSSDFSIVYINNNQKIDYKRFRNYKEKNVNSNY